MMFRKETEFQETEIGKIPKDWKIEKLSSLATIIMGQSPPSSTYNKEGKGLPFIQGKMEFGKMHPSPTTYTSRPLKIAEKGDVLMSVRAPVGDVNIAPYKLCIGRGLAAIRFNSKTANNLFYFYYLQSIKSRLESLGKGSTFKAITKKDLEELRIVYPPLNEQKGIADVLLMVDRGIEIVDRAVAKLEGMKRALLNELLTGRIRVREENGKLTFYKETEFQDTEIGKIPKDWKSEKLSSLATIIMGQSPPSTTYNKEGEGLPFIQGKMEFGKMYPSPTTYTSRPLKIAEKGDVLMSVRAPVGDVNIAPYKLCIGRGLAAIRFNPKMANNLFYFYYLQSIKSRLESLGKGSTFKAITKKDLEELRIVYLPLNEQKGIANILLTIDNAIELYYREKERLLRLRRGLMSVLLTGRVRVIGDVKNVGVVT